MLGGLGFGGGAGSIIGVLATLIHGLLKGDFVGAFMNVTAVLAYVLPAAAVYKKFNSVGGSLVGLALGSVVSLVVVVLMNLWVTPLYYGMPFIAIFDMLPAIILFNAFKVLLNSILSFALLASLKPLFDSFKPSTDATAAKQLSAGARIGYLVLGLLLSLLGVLIAWLVNRDKPEKSEAINWSLTGFGISLALVFIGFAVFLTVRLMGA
jgi:riboflavin transporter FmnP